MIEYVQLVDENDTDCGVMEKIEAHRKGELHRAVSVFIMNGKGEMLLQKRAEGKYHSAGLWTNACCTHPRPGESPGLAALRRLKEEMGLESVLSPAFTMVYRAELDHGLTEHEFDHVFTGICDELPSPNPDEVAAYQYLPAARIDALLKSDPELFTEWFKLLYPTLKI